MLNAGNEFEQKICNTRLYNFAIDVPRCLHCYPYSRVKSAKEIDLLNFVKSIYTGKIKTSDRELINPLELDIVIPEFKLAIEFNGDYWHSDVHKDKNYHLNKTLACQNVGYKLLHIKESEWFNPIKQEIIKSKIKYLLNSKQIKVYARKCYIKKINVKEKNEFLNQYHIQGEDKSKIKLGLYFKNELVAVMTFATPRFNKNYEWELVRYATKYKVIGGASKLLKYFEHNYNPKSIITYADLSYSVGTLYNKLGFTYLNKSEPSYNWIKDRNNIKQI